MHRIYLVDYKLAGDFFLRLANASKELTHHFITTIRSVAIAAREHGHTATLLSRFSPKEPTDTKHIAKTREVLLGIVTEGTAANLFSSAFIDARLHLEHHQSSSSGTIILVWNGAGILGEVARGLKREYKVDTLFFEISNLPGKIFVDSDGTNAQSRLFKEPSILERFPDEKGGFNQWRDSFIDGKRRPSQPPQAVTARTLKSHHLSDFLYGISLGYQSFSWSSVHAKLQSFIKAYKSVNSSFSFSGEDVLPDHYLFFPMQVSNDTQIVLNSHINNIGALEHLAKTSELPIVIKPHPAEIDISYVFDAVNTHSFKYSPLVTNGNTLRLIQGADKVVTINSTVGLEAIILGKPVEFLAKSFYACLNESNLPNYVMSYLVDVDFFEGSDAPVSQQVLAKMWQRASM